VSIDDAAPGQSSRPGRNRAKISDIARIVGVSEATVSRALRDDPQISEPTRIRAKQVAADLQYVPNLSARRLANKSSRTLGLMIPDVTDPMHAGVVTAFEAAAVERGYSVMVLNGSRDPQREARGIREFQAHQADGVAFCGTISDLAQSAAAVRPGPAVFIGPEGTEQRSSRHFDIGGGCLFTDDEGGIVDLVTHLYATRRTRLSYVAGPPISSDRIRRESIAVAIERLGFEPRVRAYAHATSWAEYLRIVELVERERPEALVCYDDQVALTLMSALRERGIRVPEDVAVTGFDDIPFARIAHPRLTTVAQPTEAMGARAAMMLLEAIETGTMPRSETMAVELVVRESSTAASPVLSGR